MYLRVGHLARAVQDRQVGILISCLAKCRVALLKGGFLEQVALAAERFPDVESGANVLKALKDYSSKVVAGVTVQ